LGVTLLDTSDTYGPFTNEVLIGKVNNTCKLAVMQTIIVLKASLVMISMLSCTLKLDEEKPNHAGLAQENSFGST